ncbi:uncharacterized protein LOC116619090 isoform X2 [Nematostella vectensis]|nr:uncharacterized protein LOC116619090 isoform X2 [Nematostella vectensis]
MANTWYHIMLGSTLKKKLSTMERFCAWSGILYMGLAFGCILSPSLVSLAFNLRLDTIGQGYARLAGVSFLAIGLCYIITAHTSPQLMTGKRILLGTVFERLIYVNLVLVLLHVKFGGELLFTCACMLMDTVLAIITYILWVRETPDASISSALPWASKKVLQLLPPSCEPSTRKSSSVVQVIGYLQGMLGTLFMISPELAQQVLKLPPSEGMSRFTLGLCMMCYAVIGIFHIFAGAANSLPFNILAVFYRLAIIIPVVSCLAVLQLADLNLALLFIGCDSIMAFVICLFLYLEGLQMKHN